MTIFFYQNIILFNELQTVLFKFLIFPLQIHETLRFPTGDLFSIKFPYFMIFSFFFFFQITFLKLNIPSSTFIFFHQQLFIYHLCVHMINEALYSMKYFTQFFFIFTKVVNKKNHMVTPWIMWELEFFRKINVIFNFTNDKHLFSK